MPIQTIAIIGAGNMGGALARGLAQSEIINTSNIRISNPSDQKLMMLNLSYPDINTFTSNVECIRGADLIVLAVKPWKVKEVIDELRPHIDFDNQIVASMVGGLSIDDFTVLLDHPSAKAAVIIPNTAIAVRQSMTFITTSGIHSLVADSLVKIFNELGKTMLVESRALDAGMAVASCGIAFAMRYIRASMEGGVQLGLRPIEALDAVLQTVKGAAMLLEATGQHPEEAIDAVTTAGGITIRGLNAMEQSGFTGAVVAGLLATEK